MTSNYPIIYRLDTIQELRRKGEVSVRLWNICRYAEPVIETVEQLLQTPKTELLKYRNCGMKTILEIADIREAVRHTETRREVEKKATQFASQFTYYDNGNTTAYEGVVEGYNATMRAVVGVLRETGYFLSDEGLSEECMIEQFTQCVDDRLKD